MSEEWRKPPSEANFREGCFRGPCFREPCFREPCDPPEEDGDGGGGAGEFFFVEFDGDSSYINCGSDASLDDIPAAGPFTVDLWVLCSDPANSPTMVGKVFNAARLWEFGIMAGGELVGVIEGVSTGISTSVETITVGGWNHVVFLLAVDNKIYFAIDGQWCTYGVQLVLANPATDVDADLLIGCHTVADLPNYALDGGVQWVRISSGDRFGVGVNFVPPDRCPPTVPDGVTIELWALDEGVGAVTVAGVVSPANDGAMTDCVWQPCV